VPGLLAGFPLAGVAVADLLDCAVEPPTERTPAEGSPTDPSAPGSAAPYGATADAHRSAELAALLDAYPVPARAVSALLGVG